MYIYISFFLMEKKKKQISPAVLLTSAHKGRHLLNMFVGHVNISLSLSTTKLLIPFIGIYDYEYEMKPCKKKGNQF